ncbi:hypothetical protein T492DRAFT_105534 [Pavlovales sp. CCMP2436]|nr:hypothetical protein T492DRAFT_105534 [Pavlovales sp. CCMP2436]
MLVTHAASCSFSTRAPWRPLTTTTQPTRAPRSCMSRATRLATSPSSSRCATSTMRGVWARVTAHSTCSRASAGLHSSRPSRCKRTWSWRM